MAEEEDTQASSSSLRALQPRPSTTVPAPAPVSEAPRAKKIKLSKAEQAFRQRSSSSNMSPALEEVMHFLVDRKGPAVEYPHVLTHPKQTSMGALDHMLTLLEGAKTELVTMKTVAEECKELQLQRGAEEVAHAVKTQSKTDLTSEMATQNAKVVTLDAKNGAFDTAIDNKTKKKADMKETERTLVWATRSATFINKWVDLENEIAEIVDVPTGSKLNPVVFE